MQKLLSLIRSICLFLLLFPLLWEVGHRGSSCDLCRRVFCLFYSRSFIVSDLTFRSLIHFEFIFVYGVRKCFSFIILQMIDQFSQHHLLKRLYFLHYIFLLPLSKIRCPSVQFSSVTQLCLTLCNPMNRSMPGLPVHHQLPEFTQTHVHGVSDAIQPSHPLLSPSPPAPNPSQHQSLFQCARVLPQWIQGIQRVNGIGKEKTYLFRNIKEIKKK